MREKVPLAIAEIDEFDEMDEIRIDREGTPSIFFEIDEFDEMAEILIHEREGTPRYCRNRRIRRNGRN